MPSGPAPQNVSLLQVISEATFGTDESGSLGSFTNVPFQEGTASFTIPQETHDPLTAVQYMHDYREEILGKKTCTLSFTMALAPTGVAADAATTAVQNCLGLILEQVLGAEVPAALAQGSAADGAWGASDTGDVAVGQGSRFEQGGAMGFVTSAGDYEMRPIQTVSTDTVTVKLGYSENPGNLDPLYNCVTYYPTSDPTGSLQFAVRGTESDDDYILMGMQLESMSISLPLDGTIPTIQFGFKGVHWLRGADSAGSGSLVDITPQTYSNWSPITGQEGRFMHAITGTAAYTGTTVCVSAVSFEPQHSFAPITCPSGVGGVNRWRLARQGGPSIQGSFQTYFEDVSWWTHKEAKDDLLILFQVGNAAGNSFMVECATAQITEVERVDGQGVATLNIAYKGRRDADNSSTGDQGWRPWAIHFG